MARGRRSSSDITATAGVVRLPSRIGPPPWIGPEAASTWREIVDSLPADYFRPADVPLLACFCVSHAFRLRAAAEIERDGVVLEHQGSRYAHPAVGFLATLTATLAKTALRLRLNVASRHGARYAGVRCGAGSARPWE